MSPQAVIEPERVIGREPEVEAIERFLHALDDGPALLVFEGEPGIGKTTLMREAVRRARERGVRVMACSGAAAETQLSHVGLADLLGEVDAAIIDALPAPPREALNAALLRAPTAGRTPSWNAVAEAVRSALQALAADGALLIAIDDLHWLDRPSARVIAHCAQRLRGRVGLIVSRRAGWEAPWTPPLGDQRSAEICRLMPLKPAAVVRLLRGRAGGAPSRRTQVRLAEASGGNPLHALELLRALPSGQPKPGPLELPATLHQMVATRLAGVRDEVREALLAVAALATPTVPVLTRALGPRTPALVKRAEEQGLLERRGDRVRFAHPLLAEGTLAQAGPAQRRAMHRVLADVVADLEDRARHLALAGMVREALPALVVAARHTRARGAPAAAAELLELALELGGDSSLRLRAAEHHLDAGDVPRAQALLEAAIAQLAAGERRAHALVLLAELRSRDDSFAEARALLEQARGETGAGSPLRVTATLHLGFVLYSLGLREEAAATCRQAAALAERLHISGLLAQALGAAAIADYAIGRGVDDDRLRRALALEDPALRTYVAFRPSVAVSLVHSFSGRLDEAVELTRRLYREYEEGGEEHDLAWLSCRLVWLECWRGNLGAAERLVAEAEERLLALDTAAGRLLARTARGQVDSYAGRVDSARAVTQDALALAEEIGWNGAVMWQLMTLGFLELSVGDPQVAAQRLAPLAAAAIAGGLPEPTADGALVYGDAAEALILSGRSAEAEPLVALLEQRGAALSRTWAVAVGARCRGLILAAGGDVEGAECALRRALAAHEMLPMPVEHARTLLALGRVQRRRRRRRAAEATLTQALARFEAAGSARWADQARAEIAGLGLRAGPRDRLTASEARIVRLAASGLANRQIASALQVSPRTVEAHLGRAYRKLDVSSRAELGRRMAAGLAFAA